MHYSFLIVTVALGLMPATATAQQKVATFDIDPSIGFDPCCGGFGNVIGLDTYAGLHWNGFGAFDAGLACPYLCYAWAFGPQVPYGPDPYGGIGVAAGNSGADISSDAPFDLQEAYAIPQEDLHCPRKGRDRRAA